MGQYLGIVAITALAGLISGLLAALAYVLGPKRITPYKQAPYECGVAPVGDAKERFPIKFYLVAIIFILFDIEVVFLWAWMTVYKAAPVDFVKFTFIEFMTYMSTWILGYIYAVKVGAVDWDETTALSKEKLGDIEEEDEMVGQPVLGGAA
jgi:NADH-quinone oxidoreductase subunit A